MEHLSEIAFQYGVRFVAAAMAGSLIGLTWVNRRAVVLVLKGDSDG